MSEAWKKFTTAMSNKRANKTLNRSGNANILKKGEIVVQRLSSEVQGKAQKYARVGPREFVSFPYEDITFKNLKDACRKHFEFEQVAQHPSVYGCDVCSKLSL